MNICSWGGGGFPVVPLVDVWFPARVTRGWSGSVTYIDRQETEVRETLTRSTCSRIWIHVVTFDILWELQRFSRTCAGAWRVCDVVNGCWPHTVYRQDIQHDSKLNMNIFDVWNERQEAVFSVAAASAGDNSEYVARDLVCSGTSAVSSWKRSCLKVLGNKMTRTCCCTESHTYAAWNWTWAVCRKHKTTLSFILREPFYWCSQEDMAEQRRVSQIDPGSTSQLWNAVCIANHGADLIVWCVESHDGAK